MPKTAINSKHQIYKSVTLAGVIALILLAAAACSSSGTGTTTEPSPAPGEAIQEPGAGAPPDDVPAEVVNDWGVTSVKKYLEIDRRGTADDPYGPLAGGFSVMELPLSGWVERSQAIVVGTVVTISPPYYNSADGGFWYEPSTEAGRSILQDLTIDVERVLGDTADITGPRQISVTIAGGGIEVTFSESIDPALLPEGLEPGQTYVESMAPHIRVGEGDRVLLFLQRESGPWFGGTIDPQMPWGKTTVAGCPAVPVGTKNVVFPGHWQLLGPEGEQATFTELSVNPEEYAALAPQERGQAYEERAVTLDELEALAEASLGELLSDASAPISPLNMPGRSEPFDDHPGPCNRGDAPQPESVPPHTHPQNDE